jgi:hypothetical protein
LTSNLDQLELVHARLDGFNDALAAWLLGLRANGYTVDFVEAPTRINFELSRQREHERAVKEEEERVKALLSVEVARQQQHNAGSSEDDEDDGARNRYGGGGGGGDNTFVSSGGGGGGGADASFVSNQGFNDPVPATRGGRGRGGSTGIRGGRGAAGGRGGARGGAMAAGGGAAAARKRKEEMAVSFSPSLPWSCPSSAIHCPGASPAERY